MRTLERGPSLTDQAAREIRARIVRGVFQMGEPLSEIALANELGVSKTPVREALMELKRQGLVEVHPQRGTFVFEMNALQVGKLSELREILELAALRRVLAAGHAALATRWGEIVSQMRDALGAGDAERYRTLDGAFHRTLFELADNPYLLEAFELISFRVQALRSRLSLDPELNRTSFDEHIRLAEIVARGDATAAADLLVRHIEWTREHYLEALAAIDAATISTPHKGRRRASET
jgi:DNA-binding GntR family transcriptional regulator